MMRGHFYCHAVFVCGQKLHFLCGRHMQHMQTAIHLCRQTNNALGGLQGTFHITPNRMLAHVATIQNDMFAFTQPGFILRMHRQPSAAMTQDTTQDVVLIR